MTDILDRLDQAIESDTATPWMTGVLQGAATEIARLRTKNSELNRRSQQAESAAKDTYLETRHKGGSFGRAMANWTAAMWRDLALVLADELTWRSTIDLEAAPPQEVIRHGMTSGIFTATVKKWLADGETFSEEVTKARERFTARGICNV